MNAQPTNRPFDKPQAGANPCDCETYDFRDYPIPFVRTGESVPNAFQAFQRGQSQGGGATTPSPSCTPDRGAPGLKQRSGRPQETAPVFDFLLADGEARNNPSLADGGSLHSIARLRAKHVADGHTPDTDCEHGAAWFLRGHNEFLDKARTARSPGKRRNHLISAAAMLVALIDCEDYLAQQGAE